MGLLDMLGIGQNKKKLEEAMANGAIVIDVRTPQEFSQGHLGNSKNFPLDRLSADVSKLKGLGKPLILVCASGMRSSSATKTLKNKGLDCVNGGAWKSLDR